VSEHGLSGEDSKAQSREVRRGCRFMSAKDGSRTLLERGGAGGWYAVEEPGPWAWRRILARRRSKRDAATVLQRRQRKAAQLQKREVVNTEFFNNWHVLYTLRIPGDSTRFEYVAKRYEMYGMTPRIRTLCRSHDRGHAVDAIRESIGGNHGL